jgi:nitrate/nitrite transporter NarK
VNSIGNLAGFFGPTVLGWLKDATGRTDTGLYILAGFLLLCAPLILALPARLANPKKSPSESELNDAQSDAAHSFDATARR